MKDMNGFTSSREVLFIINCGSMKPLQLVIVC